MSHLKHHRAEQERGSGVVGCCDMDLAVMEGKVPMGSSGL